MVKHGQIDSPLNGFILIRGLHNYSQILVLKCRETQLTSCGINKRELNANCNYLENFSALSDQQ